MKKIEAIIKPFQLQEVREALENKFRCPVVFQHVRYFGEQGRQQREGIEKTWVMVVVTDGDEELAVAIIKEKGRTERIGDGFILVSNVSAQAIASGPNADPLPR